MESIIKKVGTAICVALLALAPSALQAATDTQTIVVNIGATEYVNYTEDTLTFDNFNFGTNGNFGVFMQQRDASNFSLYTNNATGMTLTATTAALPAGLAISLRSDTLNPGNDVGTITYGSSWANFDDSNPFTVASSTDPTSIVNARMQYRVYVSADYDDSAADVTITYTLANN